MQDLMSYFTNLLENGYTALLAIEAAVVIFAAARMGTKWLATDDDGEKAQIQKRGAILLIGAIVVAFTPSIVISLLP